MKTDEHLVEYHNPKELTDLLSLSLPEKGEGLESAFSCIEQTLAYSVRTGHPYFFNQLFNSVDPAALVGEWVTSAMNASIYTFETAPVFTLMEMLIVKESHRLFGLPLDGDGIFTPGSSIGILMAVIMARNIQFPQTRIEGMRAAPPLVIFVSEDSHYAFTKAAIGTGLGLNACRKVKVDKFGRMSVEALEIAIAEAIEKGEVPLMIGATCGTTVYGAIDPLDEIADVAAKHKIWYHVDAAFAGSFCVSDKLRPRLKGIERADSLNWNLHKALGIPLQSSLLLCREAGVLQRSNSTAAAYLFHSNDETAYDVGQKTIQCGRHVDCLKVYLSWKSNGRLGLAESLEGSVAFVQEFYQACLADPAFLLVTDPPESFNCCFYVIPTQLQGVKEEDRDPAFFQALGKATIALREAIRRDGTLFMNYQPQRGSEPFFRLTMHNFLLKSEHVHEIIGIIKAKVAELYPAQV